jgi:ribosomal protein L15
VTNYEVVNVSSLNDFRAGTTITKEKLAEKNLISDVTVAVKILGNGKLEKKLKFEGVDAFSNSAKEQILSQG